jgi:signal transduction histidine kinase
MSFHPGIFGGTAGTVGLIAAGAIFAFSQTIDTERLEFGSELVQNLQRLDSQWSVEVLQVSANPLADFDGLAAISPEVRRRAKELRKLALKELEISSELKSGLLSYVSRLDSKEERIERFKSGFAIVRNSQRYLPLAVQLVTAKAEALQQTDLVEAIRIQFEVIEDYFANPSAIGKQEVLQGLDNLRVLRTQYPTAVGSALGSFLAHARVLLEQKEPLDELRTAATSLEATRVAQELTAELSDLVQARESERTRYQLLSFGVVVLVLIGLAIFFAFARRAAPALPTGSRTMDISSAALDVYENLSYTEDAQQAQALSDPTEQIHVQYLLQVVRAGGKRLESHMTLMSEVYTEFSKAVAESQSNLNAEDALAKLRTSLGEINDILRVKSVPKLLQAMRRCVQIVDRASIGFHTSMQHLIETERGPVDLIQCIENALMLAMPSGSDVRIERNMAPVSTLNGSESELTGAIGCVVANAVESFASTDQPGVIRIQTAEDLTNVSVTLIDNGQGMDQQTAKTAFSTFFSTKEDHHRGLGLSTAQYVAQKHGGTIKLNSVPGKGTAVRLILPIDGVSAT